MAKATEKKPAKKTTPTLIVRGHPAMTWFVGHTYDLTEAQRKQAEEWGVIDVPKKGKK